MTDSDNWRIPTVDRSSKGLRNDSAKVQFAFNLRFDLSGHIFMPR